MKRKNGIIRKIANPPSISTPSFPKGIILLGLLLLFPLSGFNSNAGQILPKPGGEEPLPYAEITFTVLLPPETPGGDEIRLIILDEVTGFPFNYVSHKMHHIGGSRYWVTVPIRVGSLVKYTYHRVGDTTAYEYTPSGNPVRYRVYIADGPGLVEDNVSRWSDTAYTQGTGRISGYILNKDSGAALRNLIVTAGGEETLTDISGHFIFPHIAPGKHNLAAYAMDGAFRPVQQNAIVNIESETPVQLFTPASKLVPVTFTVTAPANTIDAFPPKIAGNLHQLGNSFGDLGGGITGLVNQMPVLQPTGERTYTVNMLLPAGTDIRYKYTLGDGFWNAEHGSDKNFYTRQLIIPESVETFKVEDSIFSWSSSSRPPIWFNVTTPPDLPPAEQLYLQFNVGNWMSPLPVWTIGSNRWVYPLISPIDFNAVLSYRYCRNGICGGETSLATEDT
ncbi:MAG: hypothetical protein OEY93_03415, partial [Anaerolineae bacterium]|nr:hypothetical protein [Anaerolineae bacterium]